MEVVGAREPAGEVVERGWLGWRWNQAAAKQRNGVDVTCQGWVATQARSRRTAAKRVFETVSRGKGKRRRRQGRARRWLGIRLSWRSGRNGRVWQLVSCVVVLSCAAAISQALRALS